jgi:S-formylglutathione hydrolase FrmB
VPDRWSSAEGSEDVAVAALRRLAPLLALALIGCGSSASTHFTVKSRLVGRSLEQAVILPSGETKGRPLLVLLHGRSSTPDDMARRSIAKAVDKLGSRAPVVLLANGGNHSYYHDRADGRWGSYVLREAIPAAIRKFELDRRRVAIGGFSMGGFGALDLARFRRFCAVGGHSAAMWRTGGETPAGAFDDADDFARNDLIGAARANPRVFRTARIWIDVGTEDPFRSADTELARLLPQSRFHLWRGGHEISHFDDHAVEILRFYANALEHC